MRISRKDTIVIAIFINLALLTILLATARRFEERIIPLVQTVHDSHEEDIAPEELLTGSHEGYQRAVLDEIDQAVQEYTTHQDLLVSNELPYQEPARALLVKETSSPPLEFEEVKVKSGDVLSKIAKAHNVSSADLRAWNHLTSDTLRIGQILKIPKNRGVCLKSVAMQNSRAEEASAPSNAENPACFYVVKSGDNPWKIARKFHIGFEELLEMNQLDEEKARNLKIGQKLRIKK